MSQNVTGNITILHVTLRLGRGSIKFALLMGSFVGRGQNVIFWYIIYVLIAGGTCYIDDEKRILPHYKITNWANNTPTRCLSACRKQGYRLAGVQYASHCFCGNQLAGRAKMAPRSSDCNMRCTGDKTAFCGGSWRMNIYS